MEGDIKALDFISCSVGLSHFFINYRNNILTICWVGVIFFTCVCEGGSVLDLMPVPNNPSPVVVYMCVAQRGGRIASRVTPRANGV
jgi:hypothetical protein